MGPDGVRDEPRDTSGGSARSSVLSEQRHDLGVLERPKTSEIRRLAAADVARATRVPRGTVTYVLNGVRSQRISEATQEYVQAVAARLRYVANTASLSPAGAAYRVALLDLPSWPIVRWSPNCPRPASPRSRSSTTGGRCAPGRAWTLTSPREVLRCTAHRDSRDDLVAPTRDLHDAGVGRRRRPRVQDRRVLGVPTMMLSQDDKSRLVAEHLARQGRRHALYMIPASPPS